jgi:hypothetical protein
MEQRDEHSHIDQLTGYIKTELLRRQSEIEQKTGNKPALEDLFVQMKQELFQIIPGKEQTNNGTPSDDELKMRRALPGLRKTEFHTSFIPDIPLITHWKNAARVFYKGYSEKETENLHRLYLDPKFQRISHSLEGRMAIIGYIEGRDYRDYPKENFDSYPEYYGSLEHELNQPPENYGELAKLFIERYSEKYGTKWLVHNEPPLPKVFFDPKWLNGTSVNDCWWKYVKDFVAEEFNIPAIAELSVLYVAKELEWMTGHSKFQKLSRTLLGRLDMICSMERCPKEKMMRNLQIGNEHLANFEENEELIRERLTEMYGMTYGSLWVAYGLINGVDYKFVFLALEKKNRFLDRIPALFRSSQNRIRIFYSDENNNEELSGEEKQRVCLRCGKPIEGRSDKLFCPGGACQRTYYNHKYRRNETLNGDPQQEEAEIIEPEEKKKESGFLGEIGELLKGPAGTFLNKMVENGADALSEKMFGKRKENQQEEQNNPPPPKFKFVSGDELLKKQIETGIPIFSPEFTKFFGNLHFPFRMLVWGMSGQGKSSFCLKLFHAIGLTGFAGTYISAEEDPQGDTMQDKILLNCKGGKLNMNFSNWLPDTGEKWFKLLFGKDEKEKTILKSYYVVYDSISKLEQKPGLADRVQKTIGDENINEILSHIYIAHAEKDGSTYEGDAGWEYEADIVIRVHEGTAYMMKNRFKTETEGLIGGKFDFFDGEILNLEILK